MGMFDTVGNEKTNLKRNANTLQKLKRMRTALSHCEPDRVPISDFFWGSFIKRWRKDLELPDDANPYYYYDLDWIVTVPNMDPFIRSFETLKEDSEEVVVKTGFGAILRKKFSSPMPEFVDFETDTIEKLEALEFDDPFDRRRYFEAGDNQIAGVGDGFERNSPPWVETVKSLHPDFPVFGSIIECNECLTRLIGPENNMLWIGMHPDRMGKVINRIGQFYLNCAKAQIDAAGGLLDGFVIWGDVAYRNNMFFSPDYWRAYFKPWVKAIAEYAHSKGLMVIYHGCGNVSKILEDYIKIGIDAMNPLEAKADLDAVELRQQYGHRLGICGNSNIQIWETGDKELIRREVLGKLSAAQGGGYIFQSDHSVASNVSGQTYDYIVKLVREHGRYPLNF
ncbi:methylcobalamin:coenzyme M methyltransferase [Anaerohalosphaera lusitana]|uniref:Methylcobalamin:coenzyme M methyltransferase n=1 Tax=Anaerohalosphaera lusitana TaxID=1936003 RepID=A0A1U9NNU5_9BACT|nr:uroporphyrinogen decarboxylase family protein [Anaerohalosphaera lusitana]AQT69186.1 methylcobalamin:coenzyme M methyltransferase [Anaerohalosphaera lusitana]